MAHSPRASPPPCQTHAHTQVLFGRVFPLFQHAQQQLLLTTTPSFPATHTHMHTHTRTQVLFERVFPLFQRAQQQLLLAFASTSPATTDLIDLGDMDNPSGGERRSGGGKGGGPCGPLPSFLEALEPHILGGRLPVLGPEVVQVCDCVYCMCAQCRAVGKLVLV